MHRGAALLVLMIALFGAMLIPSRPVTRAQDDTDDRLAALETQVAAQATEIAVLRGQVETIEASSSSATTPAAEPTPSPTSVAVSGEPVALADGLDLLYYDVVERQGECRVNCTWSAFIFGEVRNTTDQRYDSPRLNLVFLDANGNILGNVMGEPAQPMIDPGEVAAFEADIQTTDPQVGDWTEIDIQLEGQWGTQFQLPRTEQRVLEVEDLEESERSDTSLVLSGNVRNAGEVAVDGPQVAALVYDAAGYYRGKMIDLDVYDVTVPPGKTARFSIRSDYQAFETLELAGPGWTYRVIAY